MKKIITNIFRVIITLIVFILLTHSPVINSIPFIIIESGSIVLYWNTQEYILID